LSIRWGCIPETLLGWTNNWFRAKVNRGKEKVERFLGEIICQAQYIRIYACRRMIDIISNAKWVSKSL